MFNHHNLNKIKNSLILLRCPSENFWLNSQGKPDNIFFMFKVEENFTSSLGQIESVTAAGWGLDRNDLKLFAYTNFLKIFLRQKVWTRVRRFIRRNFTTDCQYLCFVAKIFLLDILKNEKLKVLEIQLIAKDLNHYFHNNR